MGGDKAISLEEIKNETVDLVINSFIFFVNSLLKFYWLYLEILCFFFQFQKSPRSTVFSFSLFSFGSKETKSQFCFAIFSIKLINRKLWYTRNYWSILILFFYIYTVLLELRDALLPVFEFLFFFFFSHQKTISKLSYKPLSPPSFSMFCSLSYIYASSGPSLLAQLHKKIPLKFHLTTRIKHELYIYIYLPCHKIIWFCFKS